MSASAKGSVGSRVLSARTVVQLCAIVAHRACTRAHAVRREAKPTVQLQLISLHFEQREYLRDGVDRASIDLSLRKPTGY